MENDYWGAERRFQAALRAALPWGWHEVNLEVDGDADSVACMGNVVPLISGSKPRGLDCLSPSFHLESEAAQLYEASRSRPNGPWYHCRINLNRFNGRGFRYWWEGDPVLRLDDLHPRLDGRFPLFVFGRPLNASFLASLPPARGTFAVGERVRRLMRDRRPVPDRLLEISAINDWLSALGGGGLDQFFFKFEPLGFRSLGERTFAAIRRGLRHFDIEAAAAAFDEALRIYAPHIDAARTACNEAGLEPEPDHAVQDNGRIKRLTNHIRADALGWATRIGQYVVEHAEEIAAYDGT